MKASSDWGLDELELQAHSECLVSSGFLLNYRSLQVQQTAHFKHCAHHLSLMNLDLLLLEIKIPTHSLQNYLHTKHHRHHHMSHLNPDQTYQRRDNILQIVLHLLQAHLFL